MPYRNYRGVNRAVQDEEEIKKLKEEHKKKQRAKAKRWCLLIGLTVAEFVLCLICFILGYYYYHSIETFRNQHRIKHSNTVRYILEPPAPLAIASVFLALTYVDLVSWHSLRPITYFGWIMVSTAGFLMFLLYAGCIILSCNHVPAYIAIFFGCVTALVFLGDMVCSLMSLKRFPVPYWVLKRKYEKFEQCVCTADYDPEEVEVERPICRCGDHWGEPCTCDDPDTTCGCGADKKGKPPCECCECAPIIVPAPEPDAPVCDYNARQSMLSTMSGPDWEEEPRKTMFSQANFFEDEPFCYRTSGRHCIDAGPQAAPRGQSVYVDTMGEPFTIRKSLAASQANVSRKSGFAQRQSSVSPYGNLGTSPSKFAHASLAVPSRTQSVGRQSMAASVKTRQSVAVSARTAPSVAKGLTSPSFDVAAKLGMHDPLTDTVGTPTMGMASRMALPKDRKSMGGRRSQFAYSVYTTRVDDEEKLHKTLECKYHRKKKNDKSIFRDETGRAVEMISKSSSEDELGVGDYTRKHVNHKKYVKISKELGYASDPEVMQNNKIVTLPGQSLDDSHPHIVRNVSVSARERCCRRGTSIIRHVTEHPRPATTVDSVTSPRIIRNVSTTVRAVRTLSKVMEAPNESRSVTYSDNQQFPSECTITINKVTSILSVTFTS